MMAAAMQLQMWQLQPQKQGISCLAGVLQLQTHTLGSCLGMPMLYASIVLPRHDEQWLWCTRQHAVRCSGWWAVMTSLVLVWQQQQQQ
jgi:hypothetical protein